MRHVYFRLILGLVFAGCLVYCGVTGNWAFALLYLVLGGASCWPRPMGSGSGKRTGKTRGGEGP